MDLQARQEILRHNLEGLHQEKVLCLQQYIARLKIPKVSLENATK